MEWFRKPRFWASERLMLAQYARRIRSDPCGISMNGHILFSLQILRKGTPEQVLFMEIYIQEIQGGKESEKEFS